VRRFELALPRNIKMCIETLAQRGADAKVVAGGTDLLPQLKNGLLKPACGVSRATARGCAWAPR
jgi:CO/xanthine dehydrogenase FAD-binding subunit